MQCQCPIGALIERAVPQCHQWHQCGSLTVVGSIAAICLSVDENHCRPLLMPIGMEPSIARLLGTNICGNDFFIETCIRLYGQTYGTDLYNTDRVRQKSGTCLYTNVPQMCQLRFPIYLAHSFDKISSRVLSHYAQLINSGRFHFFNYPTILNNYRHYGRLSAPDYPLHDIESKRIVLIHGNNDYLSDARDIQKLVNQMKG